MLESWKYQQLTDSRHLRTDDKEQLSVCERLISANRAAVGLGRYHFAMRELGCKLRVLDIACGSGYGTALLSRGTGIEVVGADLDAPSLETAHREYEVSLRASFVRCSAEALPFSSSKFDAVVSMETIEHILDPRRFLDECKRILSRSGVLVISTPNKDVFSPNSKTTSSPFHLVEYRLDEFKELLHENFDSVRLYGQSPMPVGASRMRTMDHLAHWVKTVVYDLPIAEIILRPILQLLSPQYAPVDLTNPSLFEQILRFQPSIVPIDEIKQGSIATIFIAVAASERDKSAP